MKVLLTIMVVCAGLALLPLVWVTAGWLFITAYELVTASEVTDTFWNWRHFGAGLAAFLISSLISSHS